MPSMTWLLESTSFSRGFLLRKIVGTGTQAGPACHSSWKSSRPTPPLSLPWPSSRGRGGDLREAIPSFPALLRPAPALLLHWSPGFDQYPTCPLVSLGVEIFVCIMRALGQMVSEVPPSLGAQVHYRAHSRCGRRKAQQHMYSSVPLPGASGTLPGLLPTWEEAGMETLLS